MTRIFSAGYKGGYRTWSRDVMQPEKKKFQRNALSPYSEQLTEAEISGEQFTIFTTAKQHNLDDSNSQKVINQIL